MANEAFDRWWNSSKYMQVVYSGAAERQIALDSWNARAALSSAAVAERESNSDQTFLLGNAVRRVSELEAERARLRAERDDLKDEWQAEFESRVEANTALRMTKARLGEAMKALNLIDALDPEEHVYGCSDDALRGIVIQMGQIARRVREGGKVDG